MVLLQDALRKIRCVLLVPLQKQLLLALPVVSRVLSELVDYAKVPQVAGLQADLWMPKSLDLLSHEPARDVPEDILDIWLQGIMHELASQHCISGGNTLLVIDVVCIEHVE